jgi:hypothetical protein
MRLTNTGLIVGLSITSLRLRQIATHMLLFVRRQPAVEPAAISMVYQTNHGGRGE